MRQRVVHPNILFTTPAPNLPQIALFIFYQCWAYAAITAMAQWDAGFSAQPLFSSALVASYCLWTLPALLIFSLTDVDIAPGLLFEFPGLYGRHCTLQARQPSFSLTFQLCTLAFTFRQM